MRISLLGLIVVVGLPMSASAQRGSVGAVDDFFAISSDAVERKQSLAQTAPNVQTNDENIPEMGAILKVIRPPERGILDKFDPQLGSFVYHPNYNGIPGTRKWNGTDRFVYAVLVDDKQVSSATVTIGTRYDGYTYFLDPAGDPTDRMPPSRGGLMLGGGSDSRPRPDADRAPWLQDGFAWLIDHANGDAVWDEKLSPEANHARGGDIVILRASPLLSDNHATLIRQIAERLHRPLDSVETLVFDPNDVRAARLAAQGRVGNAKHTLEGAEAIYIAGGDQRVYLTVWGDTELQRLLGVKLASGKAVIGGTSAGMHVLSGFTAVNPRDPRARPNTAAGLPGVTSVEAITQPDRPEIALSPGFLRQGWLVERGIVTDTHFGQRQTHEEIPVNLRGRMGRLVAFLAHLKTADPKRMFHGVAADEATQLLVETQGKYRGRATVTGSGAVYLVGTPETLPAPPGKSHGLTFGPLMVRKLPAHNPVDFAAVCVDVERWRVLVGGVAYTIAAEDTPSGAPGLRNLTDPLRDVYDHPLR